MRMTKTSKTNNAKPTTTLSDFNLKTDSSSQTSIEIALKIDENRITTASILYAFLQLLPAHFSDWCRRNIKNNKFATENEDYIVFTIECEKPKNWRKTKNR